MKEEFKRMLFSPAFWLAFGVLFLSLQGYAIPMYVSQCSYQLPMDMRDSALHFSLGGIFFGGMQLIVPFCAALSCTTVQVEDIRSGTLAWSLIRSSKRRYILRKNVCAFLAGALSVGGAFLTHVLLWHMLALPYDPIRYPNQEIGFWEESFFYQWATIRHAAPILIEITLGMALSSGIWAVFSMAVAIWLPDQILMLAIPASVYKLWSGNLSYYLFEFRLPTPDTLFNDAQTVHGDLQCLLCYLVLLLISLALYRQGLKRRIEHA